jgi:hypothetical protein
VEDSEAPGLQENHRHFKLNGIAIEGVPPDRNFSSSESVPVEQTDFLENPRSLTGRSNGIQFEAAESASPSETKS